MRLCLNSVGFCDRDTRCTLSPAFFSLLRFNRFVSSSMPPVFPAHLILVSEGPSLQELETDNGKDIAAAGKVEDVAAANTMEDVAAADTVKDVTVACSVTVNVEDVVADSVKDVVLFERLSEEPLPSELEAGNVKESVALSESTLLMSFNPSRITYFLLSTRASDIPWSPQSVRECPPLSNPVREAPCLGMFVGLSRSPPGKRPQASVLLSADIEDGGGKSSPLYSRTSNDLARKSSLCKYRGRAPYHHDQLGRRRGSMQWSLLNFALHNAN